MSEMKNRTALIVEDDPGSKKYICLLMNKLNCQYIAAESGEQAIVMLKDQVVDIMLLDIALGPGMSGIDLGLQLKKESQYASTPMIAVSAFSKEEVEQLNPAGFNDYLTKPYTIKELELILKKYLY
jgi:CheY-like chemotaxis protein